MRVKKNLCYVGLYKSSVFKGKNIGLYWETTKHTNMKQKTDTQLLSVKARDMCSYHQT
jgi:hypothetical protein